MLHATTETYSNVFIVVDALDECTNVDGTRDLLLSELFLLQSQSKTVVCLLTTTRFIPEILDQFEHCATLEIRASDDDVSKYLDGQMSRLAPCVARRNDLRDEIKTTIIKATDGMYVSVLVEIGLCQLITFSRFLLAQLHFSSLTDKTTPKKVRTALESMQKGADALTDAYKTTLDRIKGQPPGLQDLAQQVLSWITYSQRPLTVLELQHALAAELGDAEIDSENIEEESSMVSVCAGLITVDESKIIRFVHYTTQEFFENIECGWLSNAQLKIAMSCIAYLSFDIFGSGSCSTDEQLELRLKTNPFLDYAARYWGHHASHVERKIKEVIIASLLRKEDNVSCATQVLYGSEHDLPWRPLFSQQKPTALHLLAYFGLVECTFALLESKYDPDLMDSRYRTPLSLAAERGQEKIVKLFLARDDVDADQNDEHGQTPLCWAAKSVDETIVKILLAGVNVKTDSLDNDFQTPLSLAAERGYEKIVEPFLARDDMNADQNYRYSQTPLSLAARRGHETIVKLLLTRDDVRANFRDKFFHRTPLCWATIEGHEAIVKLLLARYDVKADSKGNDGRTPLYWAVMEGHKTIVPLLLAREEVMAEVDTLRWLRDERDRLATYGAENLLIDSTIQEMERHLLPAASTS